MHRDAKVEAIEEAGSAAASHSAACEGLWLGLIRSGRKTVEGRLHNGLWTSVRPGDTLTLYDKCDAKSTVRCIVSEKLRATDFRALYELCGESLLPRLSAPELVGAGLEAAEYAASPWSVYLRFYPLALSVYHGVVGVRLQVLS